MEKGDPRLFHCVLSSSVDFQARKNFDSFLSSNHNPTPQTHSFSSSPSPFPPCLESSRSSRQRSDTILSTRSSQRTTSSRSLEEFQSLASESNLAQRRTRREGRRRLVPISIHPYASLRSVHILRTRKADLSLSFVRTRELLTPKCRGRFLSSLESSRTRWISSWTRMPLSLLRQKRMRGESIVFTCLSGV